MKTAIHRTPSVILTIAILFVSGLMPTSTDAAPVSSVDKVTLLLDEFEGNGLGTGDSGSINGGFATLFGDTGGMTFSEDAGNSEAVITSNDNSGGFNKTGGMVSNSAVDTSKIFTVRWETSGANLFGGNGEGHVVGLSAGSGGGFDLEIFVEGRSLEFRADGQTILADQDKQDVNIGATVEATFDSSGFLLTFSSGSDFSGDWSAHGVNYSNLSDANGMSYITAGIVDRGGRGPGAPFVEFDSIEVTGLPEPTSGLLLVVAGLLALRRRSRK